MALAVLLTGIDGFGGELWRTDAFWWDAPRVEKLLGTRLKPDEPQPAWSTRVSLAEFQQLMTMFPVRFDHHQHHYDALNKQRTEAVEVKISLYEWSSD